MHKSKIMALAAGGLAAALSVTACGGASSSATVDSKTLSAVKGPATGSISYESWTPTQQTMDDIVKGFKAENPNVQVTPKLEPYADYQTSLKTELAAGGGPDVFVVAPGAMFNQFKSFMVPLDAMASATDGSNWQAKFRQPSLARGQADGHTYGLPSGYGLAGMIWVDKTLLQQYGLPVPTSYDQLKSDAAALRSHGIAGLALGAKDAWQDVDYYMAIANCIDKQALYDAMEGKGKWTAPSLVKAFAGWRQLFGDHVVQDGAVGASTYNDTYNLFLDKKAAFFANGSWNLDMYKNSADKINQLNVSVIGFPAPDCSGQAPVTGDVSDIIAVNKNSKNKAAAFKLARYMTEGKGAQTIIDAFLDFPDTSNGLHPTVQQSAGAQGVRSDIEKLMSDDFAGYRQIPSTDVNDTLGQVLVAVALGRVSPEQAAQQVQQAASSSN